jgi:2-keto-3-deoxy-6-phosphogluconate aldolase
LQNFRWTLSIISLLTKPHISPKIVVFTRARLHHFHLEIVKDYVYLGVICSSTGSYLNTKKKIVGKATKALYEALTKGRVHNLSIKCVLL